MSSRTVTTAAQTEAQAAHKTVLCFVELDFLSGFVRVTNAGHDVAWNGFTWQGVGALGAVEPTVESNSLEAHGMTFSISGVDGTGIAIALGEHYQGRSAKMWLAFINAAGQIVVDPVQVFGGRMDQMSIADGNEAAISVTAESRLADWARPRLRRYNDADQQAEYPGDRGFEFIVDGANKEIVWGRG